MKGVIYCRVSSKEQVEGTSLESQEVACREHAVRHGIDVQRVFIERGESAKFADRTQLLELLEFTSDRRNGIEVLLVWKIDRLARNVGDHFNIKASLLKHGIKVVSVTEPIDSNPEGKLLETILAGFAQFDNDLRATRTVQGMRRKIQEGIFPWKPPFGYKSVNPAGSKKNEPDQPDQPAFGLLQRAWKEFATGAHTKAEILQLMRKWGLETKSGSPLSKQSLDNIFRDPFYAGIIRDPWSREEHTGRHLPMVSREIFADVQEVIRHRNHSVRHEKVRAGLPLRMFARCRACIHHVTGGFSRGRSKYYPYYHCFNPSCPNRMNVQAVIAHTEFAEFLDAITPDRKSIQDIKNDILAAIHARTKTRASLNEKQQLELKRIEEQQRRLIEMRSDNLITDAEFTAHRELIRQRSLSVQAAARPQPETEKEMRNNLDIICAPLSRLSKTWNELEPNQMQRFQQLILPTGFVIGKIGTAEMGSLFSVLSASRRGESLMVPPTGHFWNQLINEISTFSTLFSDPHAAAA